jgi:predicted ribosome quality control (RQC) complex YloA/Tae2 family protein
VPFTLTLDPARSAVQNAQDWYDEARKRDRAMERLPALIAETKLELEKAERALERARLGDLPAEPSAPKQATRPDKSAPRLPYKQFRTSSGLEVRVGRSSKDNDELTLRHSAAHDIWMHARAVGGAHVVLRWSDPDGNPPKQDMVEAATLAAVNSRARHAGTVPVDWTRRKYVRKRRGAPAGQVMLEQSKTIFVQPNPALEEKLRWI